MKKLFLALFLPLFVFAFQWDYTHDYILKKDEVAVIRVVKRDDKSEKILHLRWTLYANARLVLLVKYNDFPTQYIVQKEYKRNSIKIALMDDYSNAYKRSFLILKFLDFDEGKKTAHIRASISDPNKRLEIGFSKPKKSKG